jgi:hypothetical protein
MNKITLNNAIGLLEECLNTDGDLDLVYWFMGEKDLIRQTLEELKYYEKELNDES